ARPGERACAPARRQVEGGACTRRAMQRRIPRPREDAMSFACLDGLPAMLTNTRGASAAPTLAFPTSSHTRFAPAHFPHDNRVGPNVSEPAKILIVEDDFLAASEIEDVLREAGYEIAGIADSAQAAAKLARSELPTLIIMDVRLIGRADGV